MVGGPADVTPPQPSPDEVNWREFVRFLPDVGRLLARVARDPRVSWRAKAVAGGAVVYVLSPIDLIPDFVPGIGGVDDVYLVVRALRYLLHSAGYELLEELWPGTEQGFAALVAVGGLRAEP